uniref:Uncharacterized protein n=1 Tax=Gouania willdenowi TaxID=441366 RepID=A0A8C5HZE4_GOUWI
VVPLRLPVQLLHQDQLRIFNPVNLIALDVVHPHVLVHGEVQRDARPHRGVLGDLQTRLFPGELGGVVVNVLDLHLHVDELELLFGEADHVKGDEALQGVFTDALPVNPLPDAQLPVALPQTDEGRVELFHHPEIAPGAARRRQDVLGLFVREALPLILRSLVLDVRPSDLSSPLLSAATCSSLKACPLCNLTSKASVPEVLGRLPLRQFV